MSNCRLCGAELNIKHATVVSTPAGTQLFSDDADVAASLKTDINIVECSQCALIQLTGDPVVYEQVSSSSSCVSGPLTQHRLGQLRELFRMHGEPEGAGRLLEIGCGDGYLLEKASHLFEGVVGIEPTKRNAATAAARGLDVRQMLMGREVVMPDAPFDYFCSFHVFEHVTNIPSVLQGVARALAADAVGVVEVPATEAAIEHRRFGDFMPDHLNYFTESTLRMALEGSGFAIERIYRDWEGEHLVAYVRKRALSSSIAFIAERQKLLQQLADSVAERRVPFVIWGVSHHILPYISTLQHIPGFSAVDGSPSKVGKFIPSTRLRVGPLDRLKTLPSGLVAVTAPRFEKEITEELCATFRSVQRDEDLTAKLGFSVYECSGPR